MAKELEKKDKKPEKGYTDFIPTFPRKWMSSLADEVAELVVNRIPYMSTSPAKKKGLKQKEVEYGIFFDTSAIIDGRIFDVINLGLLHDVFVVPEQILLELKHIADSQDMVKRERGRKGLEMLETLKKKKGIRLVVFADDTPKQANKEVDEILISVAKKQKGRIITCDYNLEKKASIDGVVAINVNALANTLKVSAVPGEALHINVVHVGKDPTQGVGYLDDGTMIVVEQGVQDVGATVDVVVSRVIQTTAGKILFAKKI